MLLIRNRMFKQCIGIFISFLAAAAFSCADSDSIAPEKKGYEHHVEMLGFMSIKTAILNSAGKEQPVNDAAGLIVLLAHLESEMSVDLLVDLTNYYLGSATNEALTYALVKQGIMSKEKLIAELDKPASCEEREVYQGVVCKNEDQKKFYIERVIRFIESGKEIQYIL